MAKKPTSVQQQFNTWLTRQPHELLVAMLLEVAQRDDRLAQVLLVKSTPAGGQDTLADDLRLLIDDVTTVHRFVDWRSMHTFVDPLDQAVDTLETLLTPEHATALVELARYAIERTEAAMEEVDDSDGMVGDVLVRLGELHLKACQIARPDPETLAHDLFELETTLPFGVCSFSAVTYRDVLGKEGLQCYRALAQAQWDAPLTAPGSAALHTVFRTRSFKITRVMEDLARASGDVDELVAIKSHDLGSAYSYLTIAEILANADRHDEALQWAERGVAAHPDRTDNRLRDFLVAAYLLHQRGDDALQLTWIQFAEQPHLEAYKKLHTVASQLRLWPAQRERALAWLASEVAREAAKTSRFNPHPSVPDTSRRLEIALWEDDLDGAWAAHQTGQCQQRLRLRLAQALAATRPADAAHLLRQLVPEIVEETKNSAYTSAIELIKQIKPLMLAMDQGAQWPAYLVKLRTAFKAKRNFIKLLDGIKG